MSQQERNKRRALIVRRWAAFRVGRAQREIWRRRRAAAGSDDFEDSAGTADGLWADLPEALIG